MRDRGAPSQCYSESLREPIHFLWEIRHSSKYKAAKYQSTKAKGVKPGRGNLVNDHSIPFKYLQNELLSLKESDMSTKNVLSILEKYCVHCVLIKEEDSLLKSMGLSSKMPDDDVSNELSRYQLAGIEVELNDRA